MLGEARAKSTGTGWDTAHLPSPIQAIWFDVIQRLRSFSIPIHITCQEIICFRSPVEACFQLRLRPHVGRMRSRIEALALNSSAASRQPPSGFDNGVCTLETPHGRGNEVLRPRLHRSLGEMAGSRTMLSDARVFSKKPRQGTDSGICYHICH